jgi:chromosome segregation ATPase
VGLVDVEGWKVNYLALADGLIDCAAVELELAHDCDCDPKMTANWERYELLTASAAALREAHAENEKLTESRDGWKANWSSSEDRIIELRSEVERLRALLRDLRHAFGPETQARIDAALGGK